MGAAMNNQHDLFEPLFVSKTKELARSKDPSTSKRAAVRVKDFAESMCGKIYEELKKADGTYEELSNRTGLTPHQVGRRLSDLQKANKAEPTDKERPGASGRAQRIWRAI